LLCLRSSNLLSLVMAKGDVLHLWDTLHQWLRRVLRIYTGQSILVDGRPAQLHIRLTEVDPLTLVALLGGSSVLGSLLLSHLNLRLANINLNNLLYWLHNISDRRLGKLKRGLDGKTLLQVVKSCVLESTVADQVVELMSSFKNI
jgi:hypothetical protein